MMEMLEMQEPIEDREVLKLMEEGFGSTQWNEVVRVLNTHYHEPDVEAARVLYAAVAAHDLRGQRVWPMAVAPPGSMKSELITALEALPNVFLVDAVTPKTFLSGQIPDDKTPTNRPASLLHRIGRSGVILIPDFSTVQSMKADERASVFASLRKIFDGKLSKEFGTAEKVEPWEGRITIVVGTTPEIDRHRAVTQALGERFVMVRWDRAGLDAAMRAIVQDQERAHAELKDAVGALLTNLSDIDIVIDNEWQRRIVSLAEIAVRGRTHVHRDPNTKELQESPQPESPTRLGQQLCQLAKGSARLDRRGQVMAQDFTIARRAAFDCIPPRRREILETVAVRGRAFEAKTSTARYDIQDLRDLGLLESEARPTEFCAGLFDRIRGFTKTPPSSNLQITPGVRETFRANDKEPANGAASFQ
jgi:hypothetical protein